MVYTVKNKYIIMQIINNSVFLLLFSVTWILWNFLLFIFFGELFPFALLITVKLVFIDNLAKIDLQIDVINLARVAFIEQTVPSRFLELTANHGLTSSLLEFSSL